MWTLRWLSPIKMLSSTRIAVDEVFQGRQAIARGEINPSAAVAVAQVLRRSVAVFAAEAQVVPAQRNRGVVRDLVGLVGSGEQRPRTVAAQTAEAADANFREAEVDGIFHAGVDAVGRLWIFSGIDGIKLLPEAVVGEAQVVDPL